MKLVFESNGTSLLRDGSRLVLEGKISRLAYSLGTGCFSFESRDLPVLKDAFAAASTENGAKVLSTMGVRSLTGYEPVEDHLGLGMKISVLIEAEGLKMTQFFTVYGDKPYIVTNIDLEGSNVISTGYMAPVIANNKGAGSVIDVGAYSDVRALYVPYDNDYWVRYVSCPIKDAKPGYTYPDDRRPRNEEMYKEGIKQSYEVAAVFENISRKGLIIGSLLHDVWKTGIKITGTPGGDVSGLEIYGGCSDRFTRDYLHHGFVKGAKVASPSIWIGYYDDYRSGMEEFGKVCAAVKPPMKWDDDAVFGWNAYAGYEDQMDYTRFVHASEFLSKNLQSRGFDYKGSLYVNFDYLWSNLTEEQLCDVVEITHKNNQHAGIYYTPFSVFTDDLDATVEGTGGQYTYRDIILRDYEGIPMPKVNSGSQGYAADPTHPGNLARVEYMMGRFVKWGYDFVKLDFIAHGSIEGSHFDKNIQTGKQAYDFGMKHLCDQLSYEKAGRPIFISLSIAPAFPYHGHSRRISCDAFGLISDSEYMLNSLSYGWWMNDTIYRFNDPDLIVINRRINHPGSNEQEARTRVNSGIICGGMLIDSDALMDKETGERAIRLFRNEKITSIAKKGTSFRPVEGDSGDSALDLFYRDDGTEIYIAVFNYEKEKPVVKIIDLVRIGLDAGRKYVFKDLWRDMEITAGDNLSISLGPCESTILQAKKGQE